MTIYERADFAGEVGASISCAANGTRWLEEWKVNISIGKPVVLENLIRHDWSTGKVIDTYDLHDYKDKWGYVRISISTFFPSSRPELNISRYTICFTGSICMRC